MICFRFLNSGCAHITVQPGHGRVVQIRNDDAPLMECLQECTKESASLINERIGLQVINTKKYKLEDNGKLGILWLDQLLGVLWTLRVRIQ